MIAAKHRPCRYRTGNQHVIDIRYRRKCVGRTSSTPPPLHKVTNVVLLASCTRYITHCMQSKVARVFTPCQTIRLAALGDDVGVGGGGEGNNLTFLSQPPVLATLSSH